MTSTIQDFQGQYDYKGLYYSGTKMQPDVITIFTKSQGKISTYSVLHIHNWLDMVPFVGAFTAIPRIVAAVKPFFHEAKQITFQRNDPHLAECWNAFKNLMRGVVALIPLVGTVTLLVVETIRFVRVNLMLQKTFATQDNIIGIAIDGKVVFTSDLNLYRERIRPEALKHLRVYLNALINHAIQINSTSNMESLLTQFGNLINNRLNTPISDQNEQIDTL